MKNWYCYILRHYDTKFQNVTYIGYTYEPKRRQWQHNKGYKYSGSKKTNRYGNHTWEIYALIRGFPDKINAQQCEQRLKLPDNKKNDRKYLSKKGRIIGLNKILQLDKWSDNATIMNNTFDMKVWVAKEFEDSIEKELIPKNIEINIVDKIDLDNI